MIIIVDYDMGNVGSVLNMLKKVGAEARLSHDPEDLLEADKLILPGVGSFDAGMTNLAHLGYLPALKHCVLEMKRPILGICLGMQLFMRCSEEGDLPGLSWLDGDNVRFHFDSDHAHMPIPHMGWNEVSPHPGSYFFADAGQEERFYFVHSYHTTCDDPGNVLATTHYGYDFASAVLKENIVGVQFHPEKSHRFGMAFLSRFAVWKGFTR